ncbi:MAG TPA: Hsp20/alpha crystallin family protein [Alphaproteobacteria bacterium]|nr:Hsp20/alpha crystallin family protein [Alphaproteobacteria bacterium]
MHSRSLLPFSWGRKSGMMSADADPFAMLHREMNRLIDDSFQAPAGSARRMVGAMAPEVDITETDTELEITAELPGIDEKDLEITVRDDMLTIRGEKKTEKTETRKNHHLSERFFGSFARTIALPFTPDTDKIKASFTKGVLTLSMPKPPAEQDKAHRIPIGKAE